MIIITLKAFIQIPDVEKIRILRKVCEGTAKIIEVNT